MPAVIFSNQITETKALSQHFGRKEFVHSSMDSTLSMLNSQKFDD
jgi:hypothetical protein